MLGLPPSPSGPRRRFRHRRAVVAPLGVALQPIIDLPTGRIVAAEALARFAPGGPDVEQTFVVAHRDGYGVGLEVACLQAALSRRDDLPQNVWLSVNLSPAAAADPAVREVMAGDLHGVIVEITEQDASAFETLRDTLMDFRRRGARIAIDDIGNGSAGMSRLAWLRPDLAKIDRSIVTRAATDPTMVAVLEAVVALARRLDIRLLAEGVETLEQLEAMALLGIDLAQGHAVARPAITLPPLAPGVVERCRAARTRLLARQHNASTGTTGSLHLRSLQIGQSSRYAELGTAIGGVADDLGIDVGGISLLSAQDELVEVAASGDALDRRVYPVADFPATAGALQTGDILEVHLDDPDGDEREKQLLREFGYSSLLLVPLISGVRRLGVLEFHSFAPRRWSLYQIAQARSLADHVSAALVRLDLGSSAITLGD